MKPVVFLVVVLALTAASPLPAAADEPSPTTAKFLSDCSKAENREACADLLSQVEIDNSAPCVATLDAVLASLGRHPEWSDKPWTDGVSAALVEVCRK
jgi:hypothetical protein